MSCRERYEQYARLTREALGKIKLLPPQGSMLAPAAEDLLRMAEAYVKDAAYFAEKEDYARALAAISYAHAWLDALVRLGLAEGDDPRLFTFDGQA